MGRWIQRSLVHGEGDALGQRVRLNVADWYILDRIFAYDPETGALLYHHVLIGMGKGGSKTERCAHIGIAELCGPIAPVSPRVVLSAASYEQTRELMTAARLGITGTPDAPGPMAAYFREGDHILENRILLPDGHGVLERIAAVAGTTDGGKPTCHIGDEIHEWVTEGQERVYTVQSKGLRKRRVIRRTPPELGLPPGAQLRGSLQIGISTAGATKDSLLGRLYDHGVAVATGQVDDPSFLFLWWEADEGWDLDDPLQLRQAILEANPLAGTFQPIENIVDAFRDPTVPRLEFVRYNLDRFPTGSESIIAMELWADCAGDPAFTATEPLFVSVVVSRDHRDGAIAMCQRHGDRYRLRVEGFHDDDVLPLGGIEAKLEALQGRYPALVRAPVMVSGRERLRDVKGPLVTYHGAFLEGTAQRLRAKGLATEYQALSPIRIAPAAEVMKQLVHDKALVHDDDEDAAAALRNMVARSGTSGWVPEAVDPRHPIVAGQAAMLVVHRAMTSPRPVSRRVRGLPRR